jgi:DnaK suppressor protein
MKSTQLLQFKHKLELQQEEAFRLLDRLGDESRALDVDTPQDSGDQSLTSVSKEFLFQQGSQRRRVVRRIQSALSRIDDGTFGTCSDCGREIAIRRLEALPWTDCCIHCQEMRERPTPCAQGAVSRSDEEVSEPA